MVTTTFAPNAGLRIHLPEEGHAQSVDHDNRIEVEIDTQGRYFVDGRRLPDGKPETLRRVLAAVAGKKRGMTVVIQADGRATHQSVVTVMDVAGTMGFDHLAIATRPGSRSRQ
jgi:biopolymer transport protein ExbD